MKKVKNRWIYGLMVAVIAVCGLAASPALADCSSGPDGYGGDSLDNAVGEYLYTQGLSYGSPMPLYADDGPPNAPGPYAFDTTGGKTSGWDLIDNSGYVSNQCLTGKKSTPGFDKHAYFPATTPYYLFGQMEMHLVGPVAMDAGYAQFRATGDYEHIPDYVRWYLSTDGGSTYQSPNQIWGSQYPTSNFEPTATCCDDDPGTVYFLTPQFIETLMVTDLKFRWYKSPAASAKAVRFDEVEILYIPEPATLSLLVLGGIGALLRRRK